MLCSVSMNVDRGAGISDMVAAADRAKSSATYSVTLAACCVASTALSAVAAIASVMEPSIGSFVGSIV